MFFVKSKCVRNETFAYVQQIAKILVSRRIGYARTAFMKKNNMLYVPIYFFLKNVKGHIVQVQVQMFIVGD